MVNALRRIVTAAAAGVLFGGAFAGADDAPPPASRAIISQPLQLGFTPSAVDFFVVTPRGIDRVTALTTPIGKDESAQAARWIAGAAVNLPADAKTIEYSTLVLGGDGQAIYLPPVTVDLAADPAARGLSDVRRTRLLEQKEVLRSFEMQRNAQEESLTRLRADAEVIANLGRILEVREDLERVKGQVASVERDLDALRSFIRLAKSRSAPPNYVGRERKLVRQLEEIGQAVRAAQAEEAGRRSKSSLELQRKLSMIEATRFDKFDELQQQLIELRRRRAQAERQAARGKSAPLESAPAPQ